MEKNTKKSYFSPYPKLKTNQRPKLEARATLDKAMVSEIRQQEYKQKKDT